MIDRCQSRPPLRPYGKLGTITRLDRDPSPDRSYWRACSKLWRVPGCRGQVPIRICFGGKGWKMWWLGPPWPLDTQLRYRWKERCAAFPNPCS